MKPLRTVVIGSIGHLQAVLAEMNGLAEAQVVGLAPACPEDDLNSLRKLPTVGDAPFFADHQAMLRELKPDLAIVSSRLDRIAPMAIDAANAGCHIISEKPYALDEGSLRQLYAAIRANSVHCIPMLSNRTHPVLRAAREIVQSGQIGRAVVANARKSYKWGTRPAWFGQRSTYGGTIPWIGIHALDFIHCLVGQRFTSVSALHANLAHPAHPGCEDVCVLAMTLVGGAHATASIDYFRPTGSRTHGDDWVRLVGTEATLEAYLDRNLLTLTDKSATREIALPPAVPAFSPFIKALANKQAWPVTDTETAFHLTHACLVARESADRKTHLPIPAFCTPETQS